MARNIVRFDPFSSWEALRRDLFDDGFFRSGQAVAPPTTDVYTEDDKALIVEAHLPNFEEKDISVSVQDGRLIIQAERHEKEEDKKRNYVLRESSSTFYRSIALPEKTLEDAITAGFSNGVLTVRAPLNQPPAARSIEIGS